jgi:HAD superfamily hydrolase (TIGR01509 family)
MPTRFSLDLVIFDCDGVLVDSEPIANRAFADALCEIGLPLSYEEVCREFTGLSMPRCIQIVEERLGRSVPGELVRRLQARTFDAFRERLQPVPGVREVLDRLVIPVCVASSGEPEKIRLTLGLTGLLSRFEGRIFSATEVDRGKPWPDLFLHAARTLGARPARCAVVEDSLPGVRAARAAGMVVFAYAPEADGGELAGAGATVFGAMTDLPRLLEPGVRDAPDEGER